jgi:hypothetical protein
MTDDMHWPCLNPPSRRYMHLERRAQLDINIGMWASIKNSQKFTLSFAS